MALIPVIRNGASTVKIIHSLSERMNPQIDDSSSMYEKEEGVVEVFIGDELNALIDHLIQIRDSEKQEGRKMEIVLSNTNHVQMLTTPTTSGRIASALELRKWERFEFPGQFTDIIDIRYWSKGNFNGYTTVMIPDEGNFKIKGCYVPFCAKAFQEWE